MEPHVVAARGAPWNEEREYAQFLLQLRPASVQLIQLESEIIGFVDLRPGDNGAFLHTMIVGPKWQSSGSGSAVLELLKTQSSRISLTVLKANPRARRFYEKAGFRPTGSTETHYQLTFQSTQPK
jgi:RimJ/RimL family protein N-acetyltransferase